MQSLAVVLTIALAQAGAEPTPAPAPTETPAPTAEKAPALTGEPTKPAQPVAPVPEPKPDVAAPAKPESSDPTTQYVDRSGRQPAIGALTESSGLPWWQRLTFSGFARLGVFYTFPFQDEQLVGGHGGFRVADFRLSAEFRPIDDVTAYASVELSAPLPDPNDPLNGTRIVSLRDAWVQYEVCKGFIVRAGQFRPPYYAEMLLSDGAIPFVSRSVLAGGLAPPEAYPTRALALDRQIGVNLFSHRLGGTFGFRYGVGVFNGNGPNALFNDNNLPMPVARVEVDYGEWLTLGLNGYYNVRAEGARPNRLYTTQVGYGADLEAHGYGFSGLVAFLGKNSSFNYAGLSPEAAMGVMGQLRYFHEKTGLEGAARVAWYEPSSAQPDDQLLELAAMVAWRPFELPFRVLVQYTHRGEEGLVSYPNDSVDLMLHAVW
ncbi:MAG: hypothetical protein AMXMBFR34_34710 [Myxococcaceae bacterium]